MKTALFLAVSTMAIIVVYVIASFMVIVLRSLLNRETEIILGVFAFIVFGGCLVWGWFRSQKGKSAIEGGHE